MKFSENFITSQISESKKRKISSGKPEKKKRWISLHNFNFFFWGILSSACTSLFQFPLLYWGSVSGIEKSIYFTIGLTICCYFYVIYMIRWEPKNYVQEKEEKMNNFSLNEVKTNQQNFIWQKLILSIAGDEYTFFKMAIFWHENNFGL